MAASKIKAPSPIVKSDRTVSIPPTIGDRDYDIPQPPKDKARANFRSVEFERVIAQHGKYVTWRKALICPCISDITEQADMNCDDCDGSGYVYIDPIQIQAHMTMFDQKTRILEKFGMWVEGACQVTVLPQYRLHNRDSIEMRDSIMPFNELIKKGNRRGLRSRLPSGVDSTRYRIVNLTRIVYRTSEGGIATLESGYHFSVTDDGWIKWLAAGNQSIADGTRLSVMYDFHPVYLIVSHPHVMRDDVFSRTPEGRGVQPDQVRALPVQAGAKLDFLVDVSQAAPTTGGG